MPKIVDHAQRRAELVEAVARVIHRDGVRAVSVRSVAAESGHSPGSLRHYFTSQAELIAFTMDAMAGAAAERVDLRATGSPDDVVGVLLELLPLDAQRVAEFEIWLELLTLSRTEPSLRSTSSAAHEGLRGVCRWAVDQWAPPEAGTPSRALLAAEFHALIDGLALHLALRGDGLGEEGARAIVAAWLERIRGDEAGDEPLGSR